MHIDRNPYTRMRIEQLLVCCIIVVCCHCCADYNKHYLIRSVTTPSTYTHIAIVLIKLHCLHLTPCSRLYQN